MAIDDLLSRLDRVKRTGPDRWIARCPAHDDKGPSLSLRELGDKRILLFCFAGCSVHEIVSALGMDISALFPPRLEAPGPGKPHRERRPFSADDALRCLDFEATLVHLAACDLATGKPLSEQDRERLALAAERINQAMGAVWVN